MLCVSIITIQAQTKKNPPSPPTPKANITMALDESPPPPPAKISKPGKIKSKPSKTFKRIPPPPPPKEEQ